MISLQEARQVLIKVKELREDETSSGGYSADQLTKLDERIELMVRGVSRRYNLSGDMPDDWFRKLIQDTIDAEPLDLWVLPNQ